MGAASRDEVVLDVVWVDREDDVEALRSRAFSRSRTSAAGKAEDGVGGVEGLEGSGE